MAKRSTINEFYDIAALQAQQKTAISFIDEFISKVNSVKPVAVGLEGANKTGDILAGIEKLTAAQNQYSAASLKAAKAAETEAKAREKNAKAANLEARAADTAAKTKDREEKSRAANQKAMDREAASRAKEEKQIENALNDYLSLSKAYQDAALKAKTYYLTLGESHPITVQAVKDAKDMDDILKRVDASVGQNQRNVGNYASAFTGLGTSFNQIARELPALAINANTFFLAISNNLPMFFDEVERAKTQIAALNAEGKKAPTIWQALSRSIFSFNLVLTLAVTALTLFGGKIIDWIGSLFAGRDALAGITKTLSNLGKEFDNVKDKISDFNEQLDFLAQKKKLEIDLRFVGDSSGIADIEKAKVDVQLFNDQVSNTRKQLDSLEPGYQKAENAISRVVSAFNKFAGTNVRLIDVVGFTDAETANFGEKNQKVIKEFQNVFNQRKGLQDQILKGSQEAELANIRLSIAEAQRARESAEKAKDAAKERRAAAEAERKAIFEINRLRIQDEINLQKALAESKTGSDGSVNARAKQLEAEKQLIELTRDFELSAEKLTVSQKKLINENARRETLAAEAKHVVDLLSIRKQLAEQVRTEGQAEIDNFTRVQDEKKKKQAETAAEGFERSVRQIQRLTDAELTELNNRYRKGLVSKEDYEKKKQDIENKALAESLQAEITFYEYLFNLYEFDQKAQEEYLTKIADLRKKLSAVGIKTAKDDAAELKKVLTDLGNELRNLTFDLFTGAIERQKNAIQDQIDLLEQRKQKDIEAENARIQSTQDRAAAISTIEARAAAEKEQLQQRQRRLDMEKARFDRANAITGIIQNTAIAVMKAAPNFVLQAVIAALGAVQIARVLSQPIPKYAHGTKDHPGGRAIVGDGGKKELVLTPDGRYMITKATAHEVDLPRHSVVLPDAEAALLHSSTRTTAMQTPVFQQPTHSLQKEFRQLRKTIQDKRENYFKFPSPVEHYMKSGHSWTQIRKG